MHNDRYHICLLSPEGHPHALCFAEVALLLAHAFADLGPELGVHATHAVNRLDPARTNVLLGYHFMDHAEAERALAGLRYIPYQLEQLDRDQGPFDANLLALLRGAAEVWDYAEENAAFLAAHGIRARLLPLGHHPALTRIPDLPEEERDIDILFYGSMSERRRAALQGLQAAGLAVTTAFGVYAAERDALIARSRIVLNIHQFPMQVMETVRLSYLFSNRVFVLSEDSPVNPFRELGLAVCPREGLAEACRRYLGDPALRREIRLKTHRGFARRPMAALLRRVLAPTA